jgi:hypothetical protein
MSAAYIVREGGHLNNNDDDDDDDDYDDDESFLYASGDIPLCAPTSTSSRPHRTYDTAVGVPPLPAQRGGGMDGRVDGFDGVDGVNGLNYFNGGFSCACVLLGRVCRTEI